jgi:sulfane dehydrogenase subunit SoxC
MVATRAHKVTMSPDHAVITEPGQQHKFVTPTEDHFVTSVLGIPRASADTWLLEVAGSVDRPLALSMAELRELPCREMVVTLECVGDPLNPGVPLRRASTARWKGVPLAHLLDLARSRAGASHVWLDGADHGTFRPGSPIAEAVTEYRKDLPLPVSPDVLVAYEMNGEPLPPEHGFPVRAIVPGYYGTNSVKWLRGITVANGRPQGLFCSVLYNTEEVIDGLVVRRSVGEVAVNSLITDPEPGAVVAPGEHRITGWAWGAGEVTAVDISEDQGASWRPARLEPMRDRAWQRFESTFTVREPGEHRILTRARDRHGVQPVHHEINQITDVTVRVAKP